MSLAAAPTFTNGTTGNVIASGSLAASANETQVFYVGVSGQSGAQGSITTGTALSGTLQVSCTYGTVAATAGLHIQVFSTSDGGTTYDTVGVPGGDYVQAAVTSTTVTGPPLMLPPGQYKLKLTNTDATNGVTLVFATLGTTA